MSNPQIKPPNLWDPWPGESDQAYAAFRFYRDMAYPEGFGGPWVKRDVLTTAHHFRYSVATVRSWCSSFKWAKRCLEYDHHLDLQAKEVEIAHHKRLKAAQLRRTAKLASHLEEQLEKAVAQSEALEDVPILAFKDILKGLDVLFKQERLIAGESTENVTSDGKLAVSEDWDLSGMSLEELEQIEALRAKAKKKS